MAYGRVQMARSERNDPAQSRVTIRDVAAAAEVSIATVSHALNRKGRVDAETRERVAAVAERLGYRPSRVARALRTQKFGAIAFLVPAFERPGTQAQMLSLDIYMRQVSAAARALITHDYSLTLMPAASVDDLGSYGVDGGIICDPLRGDPLVAAFVDQGLPVVTIERRPEAPQDRLHVRADNEGNTLELLDHLAGAGAQRVGLLSITADIAWARETETAFLAWCDARGLPPRIGYVSPHEMTDGAWRAAGEMLDAPEPVDAIFASTQPFASGVMRAADERSLAIPDDLLVAAGIDGREMSVATPQITAIDVRPGAQGAAAAELLIARISNDGEVGERDAKVHAPVITASALRVRASTSRPAAGA